MSRVNAPTLRCWLLALGLQHVCEMVAGKTLELQDTHAYHTRGHILTHDLLNGEALKGLAQRLQDILVANGRRAFGEQAGKKEVRFTFAVHELDAEVSRFLGGRDGPLWHAAQKLAGTRELCVLMDRGFSKDPGDPDTHWHRDDEAIGLPGLHPGLRTVHAWIPLTAMGSEMGTLRYLVGTHRRTYDWLENFLASVWGWEFAWWMTAELAQDDAMSLGDVAWHDGWVLHSAGTNAGGNVRDGYAVSFLYCPDAHTCGGLVAAKSPTELTCRASERLFGKEWRERHRRGEEDYAKTMLLEPLGVRALRFVWRSALGAGAGLAVHWLVVVGCRRSRHKDA